MYEYYEIPFRNIFVYPFRFRDFKSSIHYFAQKPLITKILTKSSIEREILLWFTGKKNVLWGVTYLLNPLQSWVWLIFTLIKDVENVNVKSNGHSDHSGILSLSRWAQSIFVEQEQLSHKTTNNHAKITLGYVITLLLQAGEILSWAFTRKFTLFDCSALVTKPCCMWEN